MARLCRWSNGRGLPMASNPDHSGSFSIQDYSGEDSDMSFHNGPITALTIAAYLTQFGDLRDATQAIILGNIVRDKWIGDATKYSTAPVTDPNAQRERKWLVTYEGTTSFSIYKLEIPTANLELTDALLPGTDLVDLTQTEIAAWVTAFEAIAKTAYQEAVNVTEIQAVGRAN